VSDVESFRLRRVEGGSLLRSPDINTPLRYGPVPIPEGAFNSTSILTRPVGYDAMQIWVRIPAGVPWDQATVVRCGFTYPVTPLDGVTVAKFTPALMNIDSDGDGTNDTLSYIVLDRPLTGGNIYYYGLMIRNGLIADDTQWSVATHARGILPRDYQMTQLLYGALPEFYRYVDHGNAIDGERGQLQRFLSIFGYGLDYSYTLLDCGPLSAYDADRSPFLGLYLNMVGFDDEPAMGPRRNSLARVINDVISLRGSILGLEILIEACTNWECDVVAGTDNLLLTPDDADFANGTGFWFPVTDLVADGINAVDSAFGNGSAWGTTTIARDATFAPPPPHGTATLDVNFSAAGGIIYGLNNALSPMTRQIPINPDTDYVFGFYQYGGAAGHDFDMGVVWFDQDGNILDVDEVTNSVAGGDASPSAWVKFASMFLSPVDAYYVAPYIYWTTTTERHVAAMMFQQIGMAGSGAPPVPPDITLLLGSSAHLLDSDQSYLD